MYKLVCTEQKIYILHRVCSDAESSRTRQQAQSHLVHRKHVEVRDVVLLGVSDPGSAFFFIDHLAHIFAHEGSLRSDGERKRDGALVNGEGWMDV